MPTKANLLRKKKKEEYRRLANQSVSPGFSPVPDGSADGNGEASTMATQICASQISTPVSIKKRGRPPKTGATPITAALNVVSLFDTPSGTDMKSANSSPCPKKEKVFEFGQLADSTPIAAPRGGRPVRRSRTKGTPKAAVNDNPIKEIPATQISSCAADSNPTIDFNDFTMDFANVRISELWNNLEEWLDDRDIQIFLHYIASCSQRRVLVVDPLFSSLELHRNGYKSVRASTYNYVDGLPLDAILMPLHFIEHWALLVHDVNCNSTFFVDSMPLTDGSRLTNERLCLIKEILHDLIDLDHSQIQVQIVPSAELTPQNDGCSCGYFVCLYAESWLINEGRGHCFILPNLDKDSEKKRILWHMNSVLSGQNVTYRPRNDGVPVVEASMVSTNQMALIDIPPKACVLAQADVAGENQLDEFGSVVDTADPQDPIAQAPDDVFKVPYLPRRRSFRIQRQSSSERDSLSRSPSPAIKKAKKKGSMNALGSKIPFTQRCYAVHKGWNCAAASAKHCPEYFDSGALCSDTKQNCKFCGALLFSHEDSSMCCKNGRVVLPCITPHPVELKELIIGGDNQSKEGKEFVRNMARYNNLLQFASVSAGTKPSPAGGPMAVILNGEFHRQISSMQAGSLQVPGFSQLYILDPAEASEARRNNPIFTGHKVTGEKDVIQGHHLNETTLAMLETMIQQKHPAAKAFKQARQQLNELLGQQQQSSEELRFFRLTLLNERRAPSAIKDPKLHPHQVVTPSTAEGMFSIHADPTGAPAARGIWVENKQGQLREIAPYSAWTDCLTYPLIKPCGDDGYRLEIPYAKPAAKPRRQQSIDLNSDEEKDLGSDAFDDDASVSDTASVASSTDSTICFHKSGPREYISLRDFTKYCTAIRECNSEYHHILSCGGGLGQRWILDQAAKIDRQKADFLRKPEMNLRLSTPDQLLQYLVNQYNKKRRQGNPNAPLKCTDDIGSIIRYTEKDVNSMAYWKRKYEDCNAIFARTHDSKKARFMITFTNSKDWPEFKAHMFNNGQTFTDRFDLWMRIWKSKILEFKRDLFHKKFFGEILGYGASMEFQGRGGPHEHFVVQSDLPAIPDVISEYVWAHIPNEPDQADDTDIANMHREVRQLIVLQLHRCDDSWCGPRDPVTDRCQKRFPVPFSKFTVLHPDRPAGYYRPMPEDGGATIQFRGIVYNNSHVVAYNPVVLCKYRVHHNVEFAYGNKANIKYALKYPFKGSSYCYVECKEESGKINVDEPAQYAKMLFRSATEAFAVVHSWPFATLSHKVERLRIHLPGKQAIPFRAGQAEYVAQQIQQGILPETQLSSYWKQWRTEWQGTVHEKLLFENVPEQFRWDLFLKKWILYKRKPSSTPIGRIVPVPPMHQERFALYVLTRHFPGDELELKSVNGQQCATFNEAAKKRGLLDDDNVWDKTLEEASIQRAPDQVRWLFVNVLCFGQPQDALALWEKYKEYMYRPQGIKNAADKLAREQQALADIDWRLYGFGYTCAQFGLPEPLNSVVKNTDVAIGDFFFGDDDLNQAPGQQNQPKKNVSQPLNSDQQAVFDAVVKAVGANPKDTTVPRLFFVSGDGGTGKTHLFGQIIKRLRNKPHLKKVLATAATGCAAILLPYGKTAHSMFRLGRNVSLEQLPSIPLESFFARRIREAELIIIDEITMLHNTVIDVIDRVCKDFAPMQYRNIRFGGKTVIFSGDFKQGLPVIPHEGMLAQVMACFKKSPMNHEFTKMRLLINHRMGAGQTTYLDMCRQIGTGKTGEFWIPNEFQVEKLDDLIDFVYPSFKQLLGNDKELMRRMILAPHNETCDAINDALLDRMPGQVKEYLSVDKPLDERPLDVDEIESEVAALNRRTDSGMPPHRLRLKVGSIAVLLINLNDKEGLINGTRMIIEELKNDLIIARAITGLNAGRRVQFMLGRTRSSYEDKRPGGVKYERLQFPIKLAFAMTISKAQGQTIEYVGIALEREVFNHGQLYTAFSRATDGSNVKVYAPHREKDDQGRIKVQNVVAQQLNDLD